MKENFDTAFAFMLSWEGGHSNDPDDPGGETYKGISRKKNPQWSGWQFVDKKDFVSAEREIEHFYKMNYWHKCGCDNLPASFDVCVFDTAVNMGVSRAMLILATDCNWQDYLMYRIMRYCEISTKTPQYLRGWINRVVSLWKLVK